MTMSSKPQVTVEEVQKYLFDLYDIKTDQINRFAGYDDINFGVTSVTGEKFVVKVSTELPSRIVVDHLAEINRFMTFVGQNGFQVPFPLKLKDGEDTMTKATFGGKECPMRVFKYVPGSLLKSVEMDRELLKNAAEYVAKLHLILKDFTSEVLANREYIWLLRNSTKVKSLLNSVKDESDRQLIIEVLDEFQEKVLNSIKKLPHSMTHGDLNEANILVSEVNGQMRVTGLIDFSDCDFAPRVFDVAIFCIYMILETEDLTVDDLIDSYCQIVPLTELEVSLIGICMRARLAQSLVLGAHSYSLNPTNDYVLKTASNGWRILRQLSGKQLKSNK